MDGKTGAALILATALILMYCKTKENETMTWSVIELEHEGFPLYLRKPNYTDINKFRTKFPRLLRVAHLLEKVKNNGLPEADYGLSLMDFDEKMIGLFDNNKEGIVFLVETFGGERGYYYFISDTVDYNNKLEDIKRRFNVNLETSTKIDSGWSFLDEYPTKLY